MMKRKYFILCILICSTITLYGVDKEINISEYKNVTGILIDKMNNYFNDILSEKYDTDRNNDLYNKFVLDYVIYWQNIEGSSNHNFFEIINKDKLISINEELFVRDSTHYYYFFPELIIMKDDEFQNIKNKFENSFNVYHYSKRVSDKEPIFKNYYTSHNIMFVADNEFTNFLKNGEFAIFKYLYEQIKYTGEVSLFNFALFLTQNSVQPELSHLEVQKVISIVFWKLVCLDAGINFHTTLPIEN